MKKLLLILIFFSLAKEAPFLPWNRKKVCGVLYPPGYEKQPINTLKVENFQAFSPDIFHEISYPSQALNHCINGLVIVSFDVHENGEIGEIKIATGLGYGIDEEVLRAFNLCRKPVVTNKAKGGVVEQQAVMINFMINGISSWRRDCDLIVDSQTFRNCSEL